MLQSKLLTGRSPLFLSHSFPSLVFSEGYFSRLFYLSCRVAPHTVSLPFVLAVSTCPVPGVVNSSSRAGWECSHPLSPCLSACRALWCHMGSENTSGPSSEESTHPKMCSVPLDVLGCPQHCEYTMYTASLTFVAILPEQPVSSTLGFQLLWIQDQYLCLLFFSFWVAGGLYLWLFRLFPRLHRFLEFWFQCHSCLAVPSPRLALYIPGCIACAAGAGFDPICCSNCCCQLCITTSVALLFLSHFQVWSVNHIWLDAGGGQLWPCAPSHVFVIRRPLSQSILFVTATHFHFLTRQKRGAACCPGEDLLPHPISGQLLLGGAQENNRKARIC